MHAAIAAQNSAPAMANFNKGIMVSAGVDSGHGDSDMVFHTLGLCDFNTVWG